MGPALAGLAALALVTGCGGDSSHDTGHDAGSAPTTSTSPAGAQHNQADVTFAQNMIPHHQQALEMAALADTRAGSTEVRTLAEKIKAAQGPEIQQLTGWLTEWGAPVPGTSASGHSGGHDNSGSNHDMPGMMGEKEMADLSATSGADFDRMFLDMMIKHHQGAVEMARTEQQQGQYPAAKELAARIESTQNVEIEQMRTLLSNSR
jgi:uncharacterized protein (DUF305 family)